MAGFFDTLFSGGAEAEAADRNRQLYNQYQTQGLGALDTGLAKSSGYLDQAVGAYAPLANLAGDYRRGTGTYLDALGINGPEGNTRATGTFQTAPGYQFALDQGLQALGRTHAAAGNPNSGAADINTLRYAQGLADQNYGGWLDRLSGINSNALAATGAAAQGQAGAYGSLSDLYQGNARDRVGIYGNTTSGLASANNTQAAGEAAGAKNLLGAGLGLASLFGGGMGGGGGLGSLFMGGGSPSGYGAGGGGGLFSMFRRN